MQEIQANLFEQKVDLIAHGVNCFCTQRKGLAAQMVKYYQTDQFPLEQSGCGDVNKLGLIDTEMKQHVMFPERSIIVANCYTQYYHLYNHPKGIRTRCVDYSALALCMSKLNQEFSGMSIALPRIGCGLGNGDWEVVREIYEAELKDLEVTVCTFG